MSAPFDAPTRRASARAPRGEARADAALRVHAGPRARRVLAERGLQPADVRLVPAAAGGPKGLSLLPLDAYLFGRWLPRSAQPVHLLGASIGAWRMAAACSGDADAAFAELATDYIEQHYPHDPGRMPTAATISSVLGERLHQRLGGRADAILSHPRWRLHVVACRGRGLLRRPGRLGLPLGWASAFAANAVSRRALGGWLERVVFSDPRAPLPLALADYRPSRRVALTRDNLATAVLASCSIPFALQPVRDVPGAPRGLYWDGGITDYHLHLDYAALADGVVLYPHFGDRVVPGWLDKSLARRHGATPRLDNVVLLSPDPAWVARRLPGGRIPDRGDFKAYGDDEPRRRRDWRRAVAECARLADDFDRLVRDGRPFEALPLG